MKISFPYRWYEDIESLEVPDANLLGIYAPRAAAEIDEEVVPERGFSEHFGASRLCHQVRPTDRILVLIDDSTRGTPVPRLLKRLIAEVWKAGVLDPQIQLLTAQGSHRDAATAQDALELAFQRQGRAASIAVLRHGGHILPFIAE